MKRYERKLNSSQLKKIESGLYRIGLVPLCSITDTIQSELFYIYKNRYNLRIHRKRNEFGVWCVVTRIHIWDHKKEWIFEEV